MRFASLLITPLLVLVLVALIAGCGVSSQSSEKPALPIATKMAPAGREAPAEYSSEWKTYSMSCYLGRSFAPGHLYCHEYGHTGKRETETRFFTNHEGEYKTFTAYSQSQYFGPVFPDTEWHDWSWMSPGTRDNYKWEDKGRIELKAEWTTGDMWPGRFMLFFNSYNAPITPYIACESGFRQGQSTSILFDPWRNLQVPFRCAAEDTIRDYRTVTPNPGVARKLMAQYPSERFWSYYYPAGKTWVSLGGVATGKAHLSTLVTIVITTKAKALQKQLHWYKPNSVTNSFHGIAAQIGSIEN